MSFGTYDEFTTSFASFVDNDAAAAQTDLFLAMAHARLNRVVRIEEMVKLSTANTVAGDKWLAKPADLAGMRRFKIVSGSEQIAGLDYVTLARIDDEQDYNIAGTPEVYTIVGGRFRLGPIPNAALEVEIAYYAKQGVLSSSLASNAFLTETPDLLLYACMVEAMRWLKDPEMLNYWGQTFASRLDEVNAQAEDEQFPDGQLQMIAS